MHSAILILGYNNTRINDVKKIKEKAWQYLNAQTVLCKTNPTAQDKQVADYVIDVGLERKQENLRTVIGHCNSLRLNIIALLPFSDPGTQLGALLANELNLPGPDPNKIPAALDKLLFREQEQKHLAPHRYKKIYAQKVTTLAELKTLHAKLNGKLFLKPAQEGNSRGCLQIASQDACEAAWHELSKYLSQGIIAEELISSNFEYSFDHVANYSWITEKQTTKTQYRAEFQQIVPAPLTVSQFELISSAGEFMANIAGSNGGAYHNEIFYLNNNKNVAAVEPNLRPAGMRIWDLASLAYKDFDPWREWLLWATGKTMNNYILMENRFYDKQEFAVKPKCEEYKPLVQTCYAGIRMIAAPQNGILQAVPNCYNSNTLHSKDVELMELVWTKQPGTIVTVNIRDNADFIGYIIAKATNYKTLVEFLDMNSRALSLNATIKNR